MAEENEKQEEASKPAEKPEKSVEMDSSKQWIKCTNCGCLIHPTDFECPTCGKKYWKNFGRWFKANQKAQRITAGLTAGIAAFVLIGMWGLKRAERKSWITLEEAAASGIVPLSSATDTETPTAVNVGAENYTMPDVRGLTEESARQALECMGLKIVINTVREAGVQSGCVAEQSVAPYQAINKGDTVCLSVSDGSETKAGAVPDLTGISYEEAVAMAADHSMALVVKEKVFDQIDGETKVIAQDVAAGAEIDESQSIGVTVALQPHEFVMPDMTGMDEESAQQIMTNLGADVSIDYEENLEMTNGKVFFQSIPVGGLIQPSNGVHLKVTQNQDIVVPEVVGMTQDEAVAMLRGKGLTVEIEYDESADQRKDYVISQSIPGNSVITVGAGEKKVILVVSDPKGTAVLVEVPNVVGKNVDDARNLLQNRGFRVKVTQEENAKAAGTVLRQSLSAGEKQAYGSSITLVMSKEKLGSKQNTFSSSSSASETSGGSSATSELTSIREESSSSSAATSKSNLEGIPPESSTDPRDKAIRVLMLSGITRERIDSGEFDEQIEIYMQGYGD